MPGVGAQLKATEYEVCTKIRVPGTTIGDGLHQVVPDVLAASQRDLLNTQERWIANNGIKAAVLEHHVRRFDHPVHRLPPDVVGRDPRREAFIHDEPEI